MVLLATCRDCSHNDTRAMLSVGTSPKKPTLLPDRGVEKALPFYLAHEVTCLAGTRNGISSAAAPRQSANANVTPTSLPPSFPPPEGNGRDEWEENGLKLMEEAEEKVWVGRPLPPGLQTEVGSAPSHPFWPSEMQRGTPTSQTKCIGRKTRFFRKCSFPFD